MAEVTLIQRVQRIWNLGGGTEPGALTASQSNASTSKGTPYSDDMAISLGRALDGLELLTSNGTYMKQVEECTKLAENNVVFKGIIDNLSKTVAQPPTLIEVPSVKVSARRAKNIQDLFNRFKDRIDWEEQKNTFIRRLLNEGGLSWELIVAKEKPNEVRYLEYRPHQFIRPILDGQGHFQNNEKSFRQISAAGRETATFNRWQIIDLNLVESAYHNRGVPHLAAAVGLLGNIGMMLKGLAQKWIRAGGAIEHFNLEDATTWGAVNVFKETNQAALLASPDALVRQIFTKGKTSVKRLGGDASSKADASVIEFLLDLIFFAAGTPKEAIGFRSSTAIKDIATIVWQNYNQTLDHIERKLFLALNIAWEMELLLNGEIPDEIPYRLIGGEFEAISYIKIDKDAMGRGSLSLNEIRRGSGADADPDPIFDVPGFTITQELAEKIAVERGVAPPWLSQQVEEREKQKADMAQLAAAAAVAAAEGNTDPKKAVSGPRIPSAPKIVPAPDKTG